MSRFKVVVVNTGYETYEIEREMLAGIDARLVLAEKNCLSEDDVIAVAADADAILIREASITSRVLDALGRCKIVARYGVGVDNVDLEAAKAKRIYVANVPDYCSEEVSDHAVALLLGCIRTLVLRDKRIRQGRFELDIQDAIYRTTGRVLGLVGYGKIARALHRKWKGFLPSRVLVYDPYVPPERIAENNGAATDLDTLFSSADYISVHLPLTAETSHLINADRLRCMKPTAILVNTSRGGVIDEAAVIAALQQGRIQAVGLDVFETEPLPERHPFKQMDNVILTSHVAWYSKDSGRELQTKAVREVYRVLTGQPPVAWVNPWDTEGRPAAGNSQ